MDIQNILNELETRRKSEAGLNEYQKNLSLTLGAGDEFLTLLPDEARSFIANINSNPPGYLDNLESHNDFRKLWFDYLAYTNNKNKRTTDFAKKLINLESKIGDASTALDNIEKTAGQISGATALTAYAKRFNTAAREHRTHAKQARTYLYLSIAAFGVLLGLILFLTISESNFIKSHFSEEVRRNIDLASIAIKLAAVVGWTQIIRFFYKNYNAEKHLEQVAIHRRDVLQSLHAVYTAITDANERDTIIKIGVAVAFQPYETGYITRREGAGSQDDIVARLLERLR